jgi:hypothetical protein
MIHAFSEIKFPNGHKTCRVFRWQGVSADLISLIGHAIGNGGTVTVRPATPEEVVASDAKRKGLGRPNVATFAELSTNPEVVG